MTSSASYGTLAWARRTSGLLGRAERTRQALLLARARVAGRLEEYETVHPKLIVCSNKQTTDEKIDCVMEAASSQRELK